MASPETAKSASEALRTADIRGRKLIVNLAHPKGERPARSDGPGGSGGFAGGYGGGGGYSGGGSAGGGAGGFPASNFGPPPPRKTFDERRRKPGGGGGDDGSAKKPRGKERGRDDDWRNKDSDDD
jgi:hypothetical protein